MQELLRELLCHLEHGETVAMATIVKRKGSVPREVGAKMLVQRGGRMSGTVGGGCGEAEVWRNALNVIDTRRPSIVEIDLTEDIAMESQGVCGGIFSVFVQPWFNRQPSEQPDMLEVASTIQKSLDNEQAVVLHTVIAGGGAWKPSIGQQILIHEDRTTLGAFTLPEAPEELTEQLIEKAHQAITTGIPCVEKVSGPDNAWLEIFVEPFVPPPVLLIAGAGHIAVPLAALAHLMHFSVSVTDDRASFANRERFPNAKQLLTGDIETTLRNYPITSRTYIVLVTRAHSHDVHGLRAVISSSASYIGMIGSKRRVWAVFKLLHQEGITAEQLARVRAPIGLDLGGTTPEEIALCIMAEITMLRHGGSGAAMSDPLREHYTKRLLHLDLYEDEL